ncbi:MAG TPA: sugar ABC transporter ATP-binding protein, partial [Corynebacterium variabile]|nr:sugar ABC transporter ATP-binding protein [Corynebacterium variabile]
RPEHLTVQDAGTPGLVGTVSLVEELGSDANVYAETFYGQVTARTEDAPGTLPPLGGSVVFT